MGWFISSIISVFIFSTLIFFSYPQKREREYYDVYWNKNPWVDMSDKRIGIPIWVIIVVIIISIIPIINLVIVVASLIVYLAQYISKTGKEGRELITYRLVLRVPYFRWLKIFKWLNKQI